jgi:hypothetical protein
MRRAQVVVFETEGRLAELLRPTAQTHGWWLRELRHAPGCLEVLRRSGPGLLVLKVGSQLEAELTLLERVTWLCPDTVSVVVSDIDNAALTGLAWDLGAAFVLCPPLPREHLPELVTGLMET